MAMEVKATGAAAVVAILAAPAAAATWAVVGVKAEAEAAAEDGTTPGGVAEAAKKSQLTGRMCLFFCIIIRKKIVKNPRPTGCLINIYIYIKNVKLR
jgi:hypothetical protein